jgi:FMN phosphatase YigB (HAD superfamily)
MRSPAGHSTSPPEEIVFVDDQPRNIEGGCRAGLDALQFDVTLAAAGG